jgi:hypothetical protein
MPVPKTCLRPQRTLSSLQKRRSSSGGASLNVAMQNPRITREMVDRAADEIGPPTILTARPDGLA